MLIKIIVNFIITFQLFGENIKSIFHLTENSKK